MNFLKKTGWYLVGLVLLLVSVGIFYVYSSSHTESQGNTSQKVKVVTTLYAYEYLANRLGGDMVDVQNVVSGVDPHDFEPSVQDIKSMLSADIVVLNGLGLDAWAEKIVPELEKNNVTVIRMSDAAKTQEFAAGGHHEENHEEEHGEESHENESEEVTEHKHEGIDPHIWLSFENLKKGAQVLSGALQVKEGIEKQEVVENETQLIQSITGWQEQYKNTLASCRVRTIITGHEAFGYLGKDFNFAIEGLSGLEAEQEVTPARLQEIITLMKEDNIKTILIEESTHNQLQQAFEKDYGIKVRILYPGEYRSSAILKEGKDYSDLMMENLESLKVAMECQ